MKKYFITGLVILLPLALTIVIISFVVNLLTAPFIDAVKPVLGHFKLFQNGMLFLSKEQVLQYCSQLFILGLLFLVTIMLGALTRWYVIHYFIRIGEYLLHRIPLINTIYKTCRDIIQTIFTQESRSFKQVALVPFPNPETQSMGFVTREDITDPKSNKPLIAVFVPTTPNPTSGYLMMFQKQDVNYLDMSVEEAFRYIISCGVIVSKLKIKKDTEPPKTPKIKK